MLISGGHVTCRVVKPFKRRLKYYGAAFISRSVEGKRVMQRFTLTLAGVVGLTATGVSSAAPYFVRGGFNNWEPVNPMTETSPGSGHYTATVTGTGRSDFKVAEEDWDPNFPGNNARVDFGAGGSVTFHFYEGPASDGWAPAANRVGYTSLHGWDVMGSFNGWSGPLDMIDEGGGLFRAEFTVPAPGEFEYKYRKDNDWEVNIGNDGFAFNAGNLKYTTTTPNEVVVFQLDTVGGRFLAAPVPEPAAVGALAIVAFAALGRRRRLQYA